MGFSLKKIFKNPVETLLNPGSVFGSNDSIGNALNDITGTSNSAKQQFKYNQQLQKEAQKFNAEQAELERAFNANQAQLERDWQTEMSNTARQRAVADLKAAGINPVLAAGAEASSGAGASASAGATSSPGGSTGSGTASANPIDIATEIISALNSAKKTNADIKNENKLTNATVRKTNAETRNINQDTDINEPDTETAKALKWWNSTWPGKGLNVAGHIIKNLSPFTNGAIQYTSAKRIANAMGKKDSTTITNHYNSKGKLTGSTTKTTKR